MTREIVGTILTAAVMLLATLALAQEGDEHPRMRLPSRWPRWKRT